MDARYPASRPRSPGATFVVRSFLAEDFEGGDGVTHLAAKVSTDSYGDRVQHSDHSGVDPAEDRRSVSGLECQPISSRSFQVSINVINRSVREHEVHLPADAPAPAGPGRERRLLGRGAVPAGRVAGLLAAGGALAGADLSALSPFRDELVHPRATIGAQGCVEPFDGPGLGVDVDEALFARYPGIPGPCYV
jgi:hypothetical protein